MLRSQMCMSWNYFSIVEWVFVMRRSMDLFGSFGTQIPLNFQTLINLFWIFLLVSKWSLAKMPLPGKNSFALSWVLVVFIDDGESTDWKEFFRCGTYSFSILCHRAKRITSDLLNWWFSVILNVFFHGSIFDPKIIVCVFRTNYIIL